MLPSPPLPLFLAHYDNMEKSQKVSTFILKLHFISVSLSSTLIINVLPSIIFCQGSFSYSFPSILSSFLPSFPPSSLLPFSFPPSLCFFLLSQYLIHWVLKTCSLCYRAWANTTSMESNTKTPKYFFLSLTSLEIMPN